MPEKFAGRAAEFLLRKRKEYSMVAWLGLAGGLAWLVIGVIEWGKPGS